MTPQEIEQVQSYMQRKFGLPSLNLKKRAKTDDSVEVLMDQEFIGVLYKDDEDEDTSYTFTMSILDIDLEENV